MGEASNETIIAVLNEKFENMDKKLVRIEDQTTKTNGRVNSLEDWKTTVNTYFKVALFMGPLLYIVLDRLLDHWLK
jgi:hypothetical protein